MPSTPPVSGRQLPSILQRLPIYLLAVIVIAGGALRIAYFDPGIQRTPDERTYTRQADIVLAQGTDGFHFLGRELAQNVPAVSRYPSPLRVGYITLLVIAMRLTGDASVVAGAHMSLLFSLVSLVLIAISAYRYLSPLIAIVATLFYAVLPFELTTFRRTWEEALISLLTIVMLALACFIVRAKGRWRTAGFTAFAVVGFLAMTTKENSGLTFLLCAGGLALYFLLQHERSAAALTAASAAASVAAYALVLASLFGGVRSAITLVLGYAHYSGINPYSVQFDSGPVWLYPEGFFHVSPFVFLTGVIGCVAAIGGVMRSRSIREAGLPFGIALLTVAMMLIQLGTFRYSFRYSAPLYGPFCLLAGIGTSAILPSLHRLLAPLGRTAAWLVIGFAIAIAGYRDLSFAQESFLRPEIPDLVIRPILGLPPAPVPADYPR